MPQGDLRLPGPPHLQAAGGRADLHGWRQALRHLVPGHPPVPEAAGHSCHHGQPPWRPHLLRRLPGLE
eukprot:4492176-Lingulodinium_polyedra.AAC.1